MILCILKSILAWAVVVLVSGNIIAFVMRGFAWKRPTSDTPSERLAHALEIESRRWAVSNPLLTFLSAALGVAYLFALYCFWNLTLAAAAAIVMVGRLPDLLHEVRTGMRVSQSESPGGLIYYFGIVVVVCALPVTWYSLCVAGSR